MKIWMGGEDLAGQSALMSAALTGIGHEVRGVLAGTSPLGIYPVSWEAVSYGQFEQELRNAGGEYDAIHVIGPTGSVGLQVQPQARPALVHFFGPEIRTEELAAIRNPYARLIGHFAVPENVQSRLSNWGQTFQACIVPDPECIEYVRPYFKRIYVLPPLMNTALSSSASDGSAGADGSDGSGGSGGSDEPLIVHAPVHPQIEGTSYVMEVLERMRQSGFRFRAEIVSGKDYATRMAALQKADIVIDQILPGAYGVTAVDAMALGKPVLAHIRPDLREDYFGTPVVNANPATLPLRLQELLQSSALRQEIGALGSSYARRVHHPKRIAHKLQWIYEREAKMRSGEWEAEEGVIYNLYAVSPDEPVWVDDPQPTAAAAVSGQYRLYPNRLLKRKKGVYVSFNLAEIPPQAVISQAIMHFPGRRKKSAFAIYRITRGWDRASAIKRRKNPSIARKSLARLRFVAKSRSGKTRRFAPSCWDCTYWARRWREEQLNNHGVYITSPLSGVPYLDVTVSS
jgi:hypothetical protein